MNPPASGRFLHRLAAAVLLLSAAGHAAGHVVFYVRTGAFDDRRAALQRTMAEYVADPVLGASMWRILQMFSLSFALLLVFAGGINLVIATLELSPAAFRKITAVNFGFWLAALALFAVAHPVVQPIVISVTAAFLYGLSLSRQGRTARGAG